MIRIFSSWRQSPQVPENWIPADPPEAVRKFAVNNRMLLNKLRKLLPGLWRKVYHKGRDGSEVHYFQHASGKVVLVKLKKKTEKTYERKDQQ